MEKQLGWAHKLGRAESLGISKVGQTVLAWLMESQIWHQLSGSVGGGFSKRQWPLFLPTYDWCLSNCHPGAGAQREWVWVGKSVCGSLRGTVWGSSSFFYRLNPHWFSQPEVVRIYLSVTGTLGRGAWCGSGTPCSWDIPPEFSSTWVWGQPVSCLCPSYQSGWMWFLQFHSCQTSIQLDFWCSWVMVVLYFSCNFDVVVWRGEPCLSISPSWLEACTEGFYIVSITSFFLFIALDCFKVLANTNTYVRVCS